MGEGDTVCVWVEVVRTLTIVSVTVCSDVSYIDAVQGRERNELLLFLWFLTCVHDHS